MSIEPIMKGLIIIYRRHLFIYRFPLFKFIFLHGALLNDISTTLDTLVEYLLIISLGLATIDGAYIGNRVNFTEYTLKHACYLD